MSTLRTQIATAVMPSIIGAQGPLNVLANEAIDCAAARAVRAADALIAALGEDAKNVATPTTEEINARRTAAMTDIADAMRRDWRAPLDEASFFARDSRHPDPKKGNPKAALWPTPQEEAEIRNSIDKGLETFHVNYAGKPKYVGEVDLSHSLRLELQEKRHEEYRRDAVRKIDAMNAEIERSKAEKAPNPTRPKAGTFQFQFCDFGGKGMPLHVSFRAKLSADGTLSIDWMQAAMPTGDAEPQWKSGDAMKWVFA